MNNQLFNQAMSSLVFKERDHHRFMTANDKDICFAVVMMENNSKNRIPVICNNFEIAKKIILNNDCDIYECSYGLALIEGFYINKIYSAISEEQYWYAWDYNLSKYKAIEPPEVFKNIIGFSIG